MGPSEHDTSGRDRGGLARPPPWPVILAILLAAVVAVTAASFLALRRATLAQRIEGDDFDPLRERLPEPFRGRLFACERHAEHPPRRLRTAEEFYRVVSEDLERPSDEVEPTVRAVLAALRGQLSEEDAEVIGNELPHELVPLWRRPS